MATFNLPFETVKNSSGKTISFCGFPIYRRLSSFNKKTIFILGIQIFTQKKSIKKNEFLLRTKITQADNFYSRYCLLIKGLPQQSIDVIFNIISRLETVYNSVHPVDIFTSEEKKQLEEIDRFKSSIIKINDDIFCYKNYFLPCNNFDVSVFFYRHGIEMIHNLSKLKNKAILDLGGYIGDSLLILSELTNDKVYSFEGISKHYELMKKTIELNNIQNAVPVHCAVGAENGTIEISYSGLGSSINKTMVSNPKFTETCKIVTIDDYVKENNINVGLIKVDIEGAEQDFLKGALETIKKYRPVLVISIYHTVSDFLDIKPYIENLNIGYTFDVYKPVDGSISYDTVLICQVIDD